MAKIIGGTTSTTMTVDKALDSNSKNPVMNMAVAKEFNALREEMAEQVAGVFAEIVDGVLCVSGGHRITAEIKNDILFVR